MATRALDVVTIMHALGVLNQEIGTTQWKPINDEQKQFFLWLKQYEEMISDVRGLDAKASREFEELNKFLTDHKFDPVIKPFDSNNGIGVVSILDKLVNWLHGPGTLVDIRMQNEGGTRPGFELPDNGVNIYEVEDYPGSYLLELLTKSDDTLWIFVDNIKLDGLELAKLSFDVMNKNRRKPMELDEYHRPMSLKQVYTGARIPMVDFDIKPDISWLCGAETNTTDNKYYFIDQAMQQFKMRMDQKGARVKVATSIVTMRGFSMERKPKVFVVNQPFYGWWTQKGLDLPMAAFFVDLDSMHKPAGELEDL